MPRAATLTVMMLGLISWGFSTNAQISPETRAGMTLIPTGLQELKTLRVISTRKAPARDGVITRVYTQTEPSPGNTYLNFHVELSSTSGPFVLCSSRIGLQKNASDESAVLLPAAGSFYTPFDWFLDDGLLELRGDSLTVNERAILQFTIEVPQAGLDDLTLYVRSQRIGTVGEIRDRIDEDGVSN